jgi:hypothetical protein
VDDGKAFAEVTAALTDVGISPDQQEVLFALLSGVLWLGNIKIVGVTDDSSKVERDAALEAAASMLGVPLDVLAHALTHKKVRQWWRRWWRRRRRRRRSCGRDGAPALPRGLAESRCVLRWGDSRPATRGQLRRCVVLLSCCRCCECGPLPGHTADCAAWLASSIIGYMRQPLLLTWRIVFRSARATS